MPWELVDVYEKSRSQAISILLEEIRKKIQSVVLRAETHSELRCLFLALRLYLPSERQLSAEQQLVVIRRIQLGLQQLRAHPTVTEIYRELREHDARLRSLRLDEFLIQNYNKGLIGEQLSKIALYAVRFLLTLLLVTISLRLC